MRKLAVVLAALVVTPLAAGAAPAPRVVVTVGSAGASTDIASFAPDGSDYRDLSLALPSSTRLELDPSWSPDGTRIAWSSERDSNQGTELYVMDADGTNVKRLTFSTGMVSNLQSCWLPDGRIAWARVTAQGSELWVMSPDGTNQHALATEGGQLYAPACSPTADEIAYGRHQATGTGIDLKVVNADSGTVRTVASAGLVAAPEWSPDGSTIAFADGRLHLVRPDGTGLRDVSQAALAGVISWSSDGTTIAGTVGRTFPPNETGYGVAGTADIVSVDVASGTATRLTGPLDDSVFLFRSEAWSPTFWPGGARIYFESNRDPNGPGNQLWQMNRDGTCESRVTAATNVGRPRFRPGATPTEGAIRCSDLAVQATISKDLFGLRDAPQIAVTVTNDGNQTGYPALQLSSSGGVVHELRGDGDCSASEPTTRCSLPTIAPGRSDTMTFVLTKLKAGTLTVNVGARANDDTASWNNDAQAFARVMPCDRLGTPGNDNLVGTNGVDRICGLPGWDHIRTLGGNDFIAGGSGGDTIDPGPGNDTVIAGGGNDVIYARDGQRDWIDCGTEYDIVYADKLDHTHHCEKVLRR